MIVFSVGLPDCISQRFSSADVRSQLSLALPSLLPILFYSFASVLTKLFQFSELMLCAFRLRFCI